MATLTTKWAYGARAVIGAAALALVVTVGTASGVGAERPPLGGDSHQQACRAIYDRSEQLRAEYKLVGTTNPGSPRLDEILAELRNLGSDWKSLHCDDRYGSIVALVVLPDAPWHVDTGGTIVVADPATGVSDPLLTEVPAWHVPVGEIVEFTESPALPESAADVVDAETASAMEPSAAPVAEPEMVPVEEPATEPVVETATDATVPVESSVAVEPSVAEPVEGLE